jgi:Spx/MgsR family transcriptional regulator
MSTTLYGIPNCDTVKKARTWLDQHGVKYRFHDFKKEGLDKGQLKDWVDQAGLNVVLNKAGTTFRALPDAKKENLTEAKARKLMVENPSLVKRPVLEKDGRLFIGFKPDEYAVIFKK